MKWRTRIVKLWREWRKRFGRKLANMSCLTCLHPLMSWWQWNLGLWTLIDQRTLYLISIGHLAVSIAYILTSLQDDAGDMTPLNSIAFDDTLKAANISYRGALLVMLSLYEARLVRRAIHIESRSDLATAASVAVLMGALTVWEASSTNDSVRTTSPPRPWMGATCATLSAIFVYLIAMFAPQFGWRRAPARSPLL